MDYSARLKYINRLLILNMILFAAFLCINYTKISINVKDVYQDIYSIESINFNTQRLISLSIANNNVDEEMLFDTNAEILKYLDFDSEESLFILGQESARKIVQEIILSWELTYSELNNIYNSTNSNDLDYIDLLLARESYNKNIDSLMVFTVDYAKDLNSKLSLFLYCIVFLAFIQLMIVILKNKVLQSELKYVTGGYDSYDDEKDNKSRWFFKKSKADVVDINEYRDYYTIMPSHIFGKNKQRKQGESNIQNLFDDSITQDTKLKVLQDIETFDKKINKYKLIALIVVILSIIVRLYLNNQ